MITTISPLRRAAVTLVLTGATALGALAIAPAAFADDSVTTTVTGPIVIGQDGLPVTPPKVCTDADIAEYAAKLAAATEQAAPLQRNAEKVSNANAARRLADQAESLIAKKAGVLGCVVFDEPEGRF